MNRRILIVCAAFLAVSCASTVPPTAETALDWQSVADVGVPTIVTREPDGRTG